MSQADKPGRDNAVHQAEPASSAAIPDVEDYAYYVSDWIWPSQRVDLMKSMLLFFDKIALALPENLADETINRDPILAVPLAEKGLLVNIDPSEILDTQTAKRLAKTLTSLVAKSDWSYGYTGVTLTPLHYGGMLAIGAVNQFETVLKRRGLMRAAKDANLVELDPRVRLLVLTMFAQAFRSQLLGRGIIVHPLTDSSDLAKYLEFFLKFPAKQRTRDDDFMSPRQLSADLLNVGTDLSEVPLDGVLDFRRENKAHYAAYAAGLREFLVIQAALHPAEREKALRERSLQIREQAAELRKISRSALGLRSAALLFALVGAAWTAKHGDTIGSILAGLTASAQAVPVPESTVTSYSYILKSSKIR